nr:hypothetical protein [uncultured Blautia sp.]
MSFIDTGQLRKQTEVLERQAGNYDSLITSLGEIANWMKRQQFKDVEQFQRTLTVQTDELELQRREMFLLAGSLERICDRCETTEQKISDYREMESDSSGRIESVDVSKIRDMVYLYSDMKLK